MKIDGLGSTDSPENAAAAAPMSPAARLESNRARLREKLQANKSPLRGRRPASVEDPAIESTGFDMLRNVVRQMWQRHPLRAGMRLARQFGAPALAEGLRPIAAAHPLRLVTAALGAGIGLMWLRPWRLLPRALLSTAVLSIVMPRRTLWQALLASGVIDKLVTHSEWLANVLGDSGSSLRDADAKRSNEVASTGQAASGPAVLQPQKHVTDAERAA